MIMKDSGLLLNQPALIDLVRGLIHKEITQLAKGK